jgi:hypothetical protein
VVLSLMQCCPSPELRRFWVHSLCSWLIRKRTSRGALKMKKFQSSKKQ